MCSYIMAAAAIAVAALAREKIVHSRHMSTACGMSRVILCIYICVYPSICMCFVWQREFCSACRVPTTRSTKIVSRSRPTAAAAYLPNLSIFSFRSRHDNADTNTKEISNTEGIVKIAMKHHIVETDTEEKERERYIRPTYFFFLASCSFSPSYLQFTATNKTSLIRSILQLPEKP